MTRTTWIYSLALACCMCAGAALAAEPAPKSVYLIGNSLTWDTLPGNLDGDVAWHVDCGVSLPHIHAHPEQPCVKTSTLWPQALREKQFDLISVQPHYGSNLEQDVETISAWMAMQPKAVFVIHSGWAHHATRAEQFTQVEYDAKLTHSPAYYRALLARLRELHPQREIRQTRAMHLLEQIAQDVAAGRAPFKDVSELYRDVIHMQHESGKYLMHNAMRHALGQPPTSKGFEQIDPQVKRYLDGVLALLTLAEAEADQRLLEEALSSAADVDRGAIIAKISNADLRKKLTEALPGIEAAAERRTRALAFQTELKEIGGRVYFASTAPQWLYLAAEDRASELFETPAAVDLYNGNNPLKGRGGKNDLVTEAWLQRIAEFNTIKKLSLANCDLQDDWLRAVGAMTQLEELNLTLTPVTDAGLARLGSLVELRVLGLASSQCTGAGFTHLTGLKKLANVNFHFTPLNDEGLAAIAEVGVSDRLWFAHTRFTDAGATALAKLTKLRRCGIGGKEPASSGEAVAALVNLPLEELSLLDNQANDVGIAHAAKIKTLRVLDVSYGPTVEDASLALVAQLPQLEEFKLGSSKITDVGLLSLAAAPKLRKLTLSGNKGVTEAGIAALLKAKPELAIDGK